VQIKGRIDAQLVNLEHSMRMWDTGHWTLDTGLETLDTGHWTLD